MIDLLCVMSRMMFDKKFKQAAYEMNQGSWYNMQPSKHRLYTDRFLATMAPPTTWRRRLHRQPAFPQFVQEILMCEVRIRDIAVPQYVYCCVNLGSLHQPSIT
ncbi:hypothetical protein D1007_18559 [Hordeum vulgare]|nr:hypothetical protein D1007_18559 [Hordeum vulgare]